MNAEFALSAKGSAESFCRKGCRTSTRPQALNIAGVAGVAGVADAAGDAVLIAEYPILAAISTEWAPYHTAHSLTRQIVRIFYIK